MSARKRRRLSEAELADVRKRAHRYLTAPGTPRQDARGLWLLTGDAAHSARVTSGASRLSADRIELDRPRQQVRGEGGARAVLGADPQKGPRTATFAGDPNKPSFAKADRIVLDEATHVATLSGSASLWQDDSSLFADDITLSDAEKTVNAVQNVRAVLAPDRTGKSTERATSTVTARRLLYRDTERSGRFEGGVTVTRGAGWRATGGESTAWIGKDRGVDCMEISGDVDLADHAAGRTAKAGGDCEGREGRRLPETGQNRALGRARARDGRRRQPGRRGHLDDLRPGA